MKRTLMVAIVLCALPIAAFAQVAGDVGTLECRETQVGAQDAVAAGEPYRNKGQRVRTAANFVSAAESAATITDACGGCIVSQFGRGIAPGSQAACGPDPVCGDDVCSSNETLATCPLDCGADVVVGFSMLAIPRSDSCGDAQGRTCESLIGNVITDAMRTTYAVDFAMTNSGGIRAALTCPISAFATPFCPVVLGPPFPITRGQVFTVLPFSNRVVTVTINGAELKTMLENGVSGIPFSNGRFPQVSGLCFTYDELQAVGSRVTGAVRQAADDSCTGAAIDLSVGAVYDIAINDFMAAGGDGYPNFTGRTTVHGLLDEVVSDYASANSPLNPSIQGRIQ